MAEATGLLLINAETGDTTQFNSIVTDGGNTFTAGSGYANNGSYGFQSLYATTVGTNTYGVGTFSGQSGQVNARCYFFVPASGWWGDSDNSPQVLMLQIWANSNVDEVAQIRWYAGDPRIVWCKGFSDDGSSATTDVAITNNYPNTNAWNYIEIQVNRGAGTAGSCQFWLNGSSMGTVSSLDNDGFSIDTIRAGGDNASSGIVNGEYLYFDDIKVDTSYIGAYAEAGGSVAPLAVNHLSRLQNG